VLARSISGREASTLKENHLAVVHGKFLQQDLPEEIRPMSSSVVDQAGQVRQLPVDDVATVLPARVRKGCNCMTLTHCASGNGLRNSSPGVARNSLMRRLEFSTSAAVCARQVTRDLTKRQIAAPEHRSQGHVAQNRLPSLRLHQSFEFGRHAQSRRQILRPAWRRVSAVDRNGQVLADDFVFGIAINRRVAGVPVFHVALRVSMTTA